MAKKIVALLPETSNGKYLRWLRVLVSVLTFGMVFPNAMIERLVIKDFPTIVDDAKKSGS